MKKILALIIAVGSITAVFAQGGYDRSESREVILGQPGRGVYNNDRGYDNRYYNIRERDEQIERIRREYDWRIESVRHDHYLRNGERRRQIRFLKNERDAKIREVMQGYNYRNYHGYGKRRDRDDDVTETN